MQRIVILGSAEGAVKAIEEIRLKDEGSDITLIAFDERLPYQRTAFQDFLLKKVSLNQVFLKPKDFYQKKNVRVVLDKKVTKVNLKKRRIVLEEKESLDFDLLIITEPPEYRFLEIKGIHKWGVVGLKNLKDVELIANMFSVCDTFVIQSETWEGLKWAFILASLGKETLLISEKKNVLLTLLTQEVRNWILGLFETKKIRIVEENPIVEILGDAEVKAVRLHSGKVIGASVIIFPDIVENFDLFLDSPLKIRHRICVDSQFKTNVEGVLAVDLACERDDSSQELLEEIGPERESLALTDLSIDFLGNGDSKEDLKILEDFNKEEGNYRKLFFKENHPPTPETPPHIFGGEEGESGKSVASADVRPYLNKVDEPGEAKDESTLAKTGHNKGTTPMGVVGLHLCGALLINASGERDKFLKLIQTGVNLEGLKEKILDKNLSEMDIFESSLKSS